MRRNIAVAAACAASFVIVSSASAQFSLTANTGFGGGNGWREPNESITGDIVAAPYPYLGTGNLERGLAYNPVTGNLILVSRSAAGNGIRVLSGSTGADIGFLPQGTGIISGGVFTTNMVGVADDGAIYVGNLATDATPVGFRTYRWENEAAAAPTVYTTFTAPAQFGTPRMGDSMDVTGSGANTRIIASGSNTLSYGVFRGDGTYQAVTDWGGINSTAVNSFRLGITFGPTPNDVYGKSPGNQANVGFAVSSYNASGGVSIAGPFGLASQGEAPMDFAQIGGNSYLALLDINSSIVRIYDVNNPLAPTLVVAGAAPAPQASLTPNGNGTGSVKWGAIDAVAGTATLYAMSTNQGITSLTFNFPGSGPSFVLGDFGGAESPDGSLNTPDGDFNEFDVEGFLLALNDQSAYLTLNPTLGSSLTGRGDFGGAESTDGSLNTPDGSFNEFDVEGFLLALNDPAGYAAIQPAPRIAAIPEPAALGLLAPMGLLLARRRR